MNFELTVDEPAITTDAQSPLSPVSPKPMHFPAPSNIPLLANQMDPVFDDTSSYMNSSTPPSATQPNNVPPEGESATDPTQDRSDAPHHSVQYDKAATSNAFHQPLTLDNSYATSTNFQDTAFLSSLLAPSNHGSDLSASHNGTSQPIQSHANASEGVNSYALPDNIALVNDTKDAAYSNNQELLSNPPATSPTSQPAIPMDIQTLLDNLAASAPKSMPAPQPNSQESEASVAPASDIAPVPTSDLGSAIVSSSANLPPRPPTQSRTAMPFATVNDANGYGSSIQTLGTQNYGAPPGTTYHPPPNLPPPPVTAGAPGTSAAATGLPPPPVASFLQHDPNAIAPSSRLDSVDRSQSEQKGDEDVPWGPEVQKIYDAFLQDERNYVTEGQWDRFPVNSRLFIGNLPTEKVTKRDLFHVFHRYGKLAQISIKQAYGFVQFLEAEACQQALHREQGMQVRGRKMHLEISKPQKNTRKSGDGDGRGRNRRSRSPEHARGNNGGRQGDRYRGGQNNRQGARTRDDYRPGRSPSPKGFHGRGGRSPDRYHGRRRSRSRSPYGRNRHRSPSPRRDGDDELPLPRREPRDVPDVQIIVVDPIGVNRNYPKHVEDVFQNRGLRCNVLFLSPNLSEPAVVRRQIVEGVIAVLKLNRTTQMTARYAMQMFDRSGGSDNVRFEEYNNLELHIAAELVYQKRQSQPSLSQPQYTDPASAYTAAQFGLPAAPQRPPIHTTNPSSITSMGSNELQRLLGQLQSPATQTPPVHAPQSAGMNSAPLDLSRLLGGIAPQPPAYQAQSPPQSQGLYSNANLASLLGATTARSQQHTPSQTTPTVPDMQSILAQLGKYKQ